MKAPTRPVAHDEHHRSRHIGWLRATVLGANDGIVSIASLIVGVAAADPSRTAVLTAGTAGLTAGALSMAVGEYVSVSSQRDTEQADLAMERRELVNDPASELIELTRIYEHRGLDHSLAVEVATQLTDHDALGAHLRDELGITEVASARPLQAAGSSAASFLVGGGLPLLAAIAVDERHPFVGRRPGCARVPRRARRARRPGRRRVRAARRRSGSRCSARSRWP